MPKFNSIEELESYLKKSFKKITKDVVNQLKDEIPDKIIEQIESGISPVTGKRFEDYSKAYKAQIKAGQVEDKKLRPVNLTVTGDMLNSIKTQSDDTSITISFEDEKAKYHNDLGAGKSKTIRKMLPTKEGEELNKVLNKIIRQTYEKAVKDELS
jgi:hypothetical protein